MKLTARSTLAPSHGIGESARPEGRHFPHQLLRSNNLVPSLAMAQPTLNVADTASLIAGGLGALVSSRSLVLPETNNVRLEVTLLQLAGAGHAGIGGIGSDITCNPEPQTVEIPIQAYTLRFQQGAATAYASIGECRQDVTGCEIEARTETVQLVPPPSSVRRR